MTEPSRIGRPIGDLDAAALGDPVRELLPFQSCHTAADTRSLLRDAVAREVGIMLELVREFDAFDLIELLRMREFPPVPDPRVVVPDGSSLPIEIVGAILLSRPTRKPDPTPRAQGHPHTVIEELHEHCMALSRISAYRQLTEGRLAVNPLGRLASEFQGAVLNIRNMQYDHIRDRHDAALFEAPVVQELMQSKLGYTFRDVLEVRSALTSLSSKRMTALRDRTGDIVRQHRDVAPADLPSEVVERFLADMTPLMFLPAERAVMLADEVAEEAELDANLVRRALDSFAQTFDESIRGEQRVYDLLMGKNPFLTTPLLSDGDGAYVLTSNEIGLDSLRRIVERALAGEAPAMRRYDQQGRQRMSETLATRYLTRILGTDPAYTGFFYYVGQDRADYAAGVDATCANPKSNSERVEGDALFLLDDVAFVVEVKGKSVADQARRGDLRRLTNDLKATIGDGSRQADRLRQLIDRNGGFWDGDEHWVDLSAVHEVRTLVVLLDDVGPLGVNLADLEAAGVIDVEQTPLVLSLHDLAVIAEVGERPSEFLLYLRRRTDSPVKNYYRAVDELDLYMLFLDADLYVEDDPDAVKEHHPSAPKVTQHQRRLRAVSAVGTIVADQCAELNAWIGRENVPEGDRAPEKPSINAAPALLRLIDQYRALDAPGWLRCGADMLGLSEQAQDRIVSMVRQCQRASGVDGNYHHAVMSYVGLFGHPALFIATRGPEVSATEAQSRLSTYAAKKAAQLRADRAYLWLIALDGSIEMTGYQGDASSLPPLSEDEAARLGLQPIGDAARPVPPSARRSTRRLRGGRKRKR